ncbi:MAG: TetR/AcrR family transcriptional regulator [Halieaceae bacterium]|jgi:AcrR family transcriptional regulator|nr:TetR/AcrR family transcriptional regulator [Halieaceae bacterium]
MSNTVVLKDGRAKKRPGLEEQRRIILEGAVELFSSQGSRAVSISDICKHANVSRHTYYRCYADKGELITWLYQTSVNDNMEAIGNWTDLDYIDPQWLHRAVDNSVDTILAQHHIAQFLFIESSDPNSYAHAVINDALDGVVETMRAWCEHRHGKAPSKPFLKSLLVASQWLVHNAIQSGMDKQAIAEAKQAVEQLFYGAFSTLEK